MYIWSCSLPILVYLFVYVFFNFFAVNSIPWIKIIIEGHLPVTEWWRISSLRSSVNYQPAATWINFQSKAFSIATLQQASNIWNYLSFTLHLLKVPLPSPHSRHIWKQNCSLLHTTQSNISSAAGASNSNSRHTAPPINVFDIDIVL